jgi:hypothetical protein
MDTMDTMAWELLADLKTEILALDAIEDEDERWAELDRWVNSNITTVAVLEQDNLDMPEGSVLRTAHITVQSREFYLISMELRGAEDADGAAMTSRFLDIRIALGDDGAACGLFVPAFTDLLAEYVFRKSDADWGGFPILRFNQTELLP